MNGIDDDVTRFVRDGFVRIDGAFSSEIAAAARARLWQDIDADEGDRATWTAPVVRLGTYDDEPFRVAATSPVLARVYDRLVGEGRWERRTSLGTFPVRFPSPDDPGDAGWHIDTAFFLDEDDPADFMASRSNVASRGRALLALFLFSDVGPSDAPTRIRVGSHRTIAKRLAPAGERGLTLGELAATGFAESQDLPEALAVGPAGTVYVCHPFLVHSAQPHRGDTPRFLAQPAILPAAPFALDRADGAYFPVERAIVEAIR